MTMRSYRHFRLQERTQRNRDEKRKRPALLKGLGEHGHRRHAGERHGQERGRCLRLRLLRLPDDIG